MNCHLSRTFVLCIAAAGVIACSSDEDIANHCDLGYKSASAGEHKQAVPLLSACLNSGKASAAETRNAHEARAWAQSNLGDAMSAVADQESAFRLSRPDTHREFINYASYLRAAGRLEDSLAALKSAEAIENATGTVGMMTLYNLGWTLQELGKHEEAIAAFTRGIPAQPDYAFVYYRRGISLEKAGRKDAAYSDFEKVSRLIQPSQVTGLSAKYLPQVREKLNEHGLVLPQ